MTLKNPDAGEVMTLREVSQFLRTHPATIYKLARDGKLPAVKVGKIWRFRKSAIEEWFSLNEKNNRHA